MTSRQNPSRHAHLPDHRNPRLGRGAVLLPVVPLVGHVLLPQHSLPVSEIPGFGVRALAKAVQEGSALAVIPIDEPESIGELRCPIIATQAVVAELLRLPDGDVGAVLKGERRMRVVRLYKKRSQWMAECQPLATGLGRRSTQALALAKTLRQHIQRFLKTDADIAPEARQSLLLQDDAAVLADLVAPYLSLSWEEKRAVLQAVAVGERVRRVLSALKRELNLQKLTSDIHDQVRGDLSEEQRRIYLKEQIAAIKRELGELDEAADVVEQFEQAFEELDLPALAREAVWEEIDRLNLSAPGSPEYIVAHSYLTMMRDLPWRSEPPATPDLSKASRTLNQDHFGLDDVKQRILEYLAVMKHKGDLPGQILLLNGPPGVGKTSLARSIADALGRPFVRISLGGVRDEAEVRGHRRTYIGSMPGKIIQATKQAKTQYSVILLDEIDKVGGDQAGVAAALLEVLDREQNQSFLDHYLAVPFDISKVMFIATANNAENILEPLRDRMEMVDVASYTDREKVAITRKHIIPSIRKEFDLTAPQFRLDDKTIQYVMRHYTHEAGVRQLKREVQRLARKVVLKVVTQRGRKTYPRFRPEDIPQWLGVPRYIEEPRDKVLPPGVAIGLAYTSVGGEILYVETSAAPHVGGKGSYKLTGHAGKVMQESAQAVLSYIAQNALSLGISDKALQEADIHIHLPDGGTPKDGPSAGIAIMCAVTSAMKGKALPSTLAMTGEVTLRGQVLPVGGIREKMLAAYRYGKKTVLYPAANQRDLMEVPEEVRAKLKLIPVQTMAEVLRYVGLWPVTKPGIPLKPLFSSFSLPPEATAP